MALSREEYLWNENSANLRKLRKKVDGDHKKSKTDNTLLPATHRKYAPLHSAELEDHRERHHSKTNRVTSPPAYLPRLDTPPEHDQLRRGKLRGARYGVVPPVIPKLNAYERPDSAGDDWGREDSGDSEGGEYGYHPPVPQAMGYYPYMYPPPIPYPGQPMPVYYPAPYLPQKRRRHKPKRLPSQKDEATYTVEEKSVQFDQEKSSVNRSRRDQSSPFDSRSKVYRLLNTSRTNGYVNGPQFTRIPEDSDYNPRERYYPEQTPDLQFSYIAPEDPSYGYYKPKKRTPPLSAQELANPSLYLQNHFAFGLQFTDQFINDYIDEELIPDILIDVVSEYETMSKNRERELDVLTNDLRESNSGYQRSMLVYAGDAMTKVLDDIIQEGCVSVVKETIQDLASDYVQRSAIYDAYNDMLTDVIMDIGPSVVEDVTVEAVMEDIINDKLVTPVIKGGAKDIAIEVLDHYDSKIRRRELKEVNKHASLKLVDSVCLDCLLTAISRQGKIYTESDYAEKYLDNLMLDNLLKHYLDIRKVKSVTVDNFALRRAHEKMVTDVALDMLLTEACHTLDEDMADIDDSEQGLPGPQTVPAVDRWLFHSKR